MAQLQRLQIRLKLVQRVEGLVVRASLEVGARHSRLPLQGSGRKPLTQLNRGFSRVWGLQGLYLE